MNFVLMLASFLLPMLFESTIDRAFTHIRNSEWVSAAAALDQAFAEDPSRFAANNFHYLRGRVAENQRDWNRARLEFAKIDRASALHELATWRSARASANLRDDGAAKASFDLLPRDFPVDLKLQLARESSPALAAEIHRTMASRESRLELAKISGDKTSLWPLIQADQDDDVALEAAHLLSAIAATSRDRLLVADTYATHRQFDYALPLYQSVSEDAVSAANARYQIARIHFLREDYKLAIETYRAIAKDFAGADWEMDADYQIAGCYWRLGDFQNSEKTYLRYISRYGRAGQEEGAVRNLVDVYRAMGDEQKALTWIDRMLARRLSTSTRQVFLFTKAKILYTQKRYTAAQNLFRQLGTARLRAAAGGTTTEEAKYFQALSLSRLGNKAAAETIWRSLARAPYTYYGLKAAEQLGRAPSNPSAEVCRPAGDRMLTSVEANLEKLRRPVLSALPKSRDVVTELTFLRLWDEASYWIERQNTRPNPRTAAELAYAAGRYHRSIVYADRLPDSDPSAAALSHPGGFRELICDAARTYKVDPLWLQAIIWQESKYNPRARSGASARGLMQFIPETANAVGAAIGLPEFSLDRLYDPAVVIPMGAHYWGSLLQTFKDPAMALAAYNGGPNNVQRWKGKWPEAAAGDMELFVADIGFVETKRYVMSVFAARAAYSSLSSK